jgi:PD-(D/E)XK nuclease superfamily
LPVGKMKHAFGVDETVLPTGKSCSWCGSVLESTNGLIFESAEEVKREERTQASRRIDITIRLDGFVIGIENKPWAYESENQLHDYWVDLRKRFGKNCMLVYLSGDGSDPATLRRRALTNLRSTGQFKTLAYSTDLRQWLEQCHEECEAERVRWFLRDLADYASQKFNLTEVPDSDL